MIPIGAHNDKSFTVTAAKLVPALYPEFDSFRAMPGVFATGFLVGFVEAACLELMQRFLAEGQATVGIHIDLTHEAPTPPGVTVTASAVCVAAEGKQASFDVIVRDQFGAILGRGTHRRAVIDRAKFDGAVAKIAAQLTA